MRRERASNEPMRECPRERETLAAIVAGERKQEIGRHAAECPECREIVLVTTWLQGVARETDIGVLPRADRVWWSAQVDRRLRARHALAERAARPIRWFERGAAAAIALTVAGILWGHGISTADAALVRLSDPSTLGVLTAALLAVGAVAARGAVGEA